MLNQVIRRSVAPSVFGLMYLQCKTQDDKEFVLKSRLADINEMFRAPTLEGIFETLQKDGSEWAIKQLDTLKKMVNSSCSQ